MERVDHGMGVFDFMYEDEEKGRFEYGVPKLVKTFDGEDDGVSCAVWEVRLPARFYEVRVPAHVRYNGEAVPAMYVGTGSGSEMESLAYSIAENAANGMLVIRPATDEEGTH